MDSLPPEMLQAYQRYLQRPHLTRELLMAKIRPYLGVISEASRNSPDLDIATAGELAAAILRLLRECDEGQLAHGQAALLYFLESDDSEPDLESPDGFADDVVFFNAVCQEIGRADLQLK